jgi:hypothetical protein
LPAGEPFTGGLDPRVHLSSQDFLAEMMDYLVKPA